jgi:hypothetical protein
MILMRGTSITRAIGRGGPFVDNVKLFIAETLKIQNWNNWTASKSAYKTKGLAFLLITFG